MNLQHQAGPQAAGATTSSSTASTASIASPAVGRGGRRQAGCQLGVYCHHCGLGQVGSRALGGGRGTGTCVHERSEQTEDHMPHADSEGCGDPTAAALLSPKCSAFRPLAHLAHCVLGLPLGSGTLAGGLAVDVGKVAPPPRQRLQVGGWVGGWGGGGGGGGGRHTGLANELPDRSARMRASDAATSDRQPHQQRQQAAPAPSPQRSPGAGSRPPRVPARPQCPAARAGICPAGRQTESNRCHRQQ